MNMSVVWAVPIGMAVGALLSGVVILLAYA